MTRHRGRQLLAVLFIAVGCFVLWAANGQRVEEQALADRGVDATATVTGKERRPGYRGNSSTALDVTFATTDGRTVTTTIPANNDSAAAEPGDSLDITYDPEDPDVARPADWNLTNWGAGALAGTMGFGTALLLLFARPRKQPSSAAAD